MSKTLSQELRQLAVALRQDRILDCEVVIVERAAQLLEAPSDDMVKRGVDAMDAEALNDGVLDEKTLKQMRPHRERMARIMMTAALGGAA